MRKLITEHGLSKLVAVHDPADRATCSYCGIAEDIHLLDGVLDSKGNDAGKIACIKCYPVPSSWCPTGVEHIAISIAPSLQPLYAKWLEQERKFSGPIEGARSGIIEALGGMFAKEGR